MINDYRVLKTPHGPALVRSNASKELNGVDALIFDCDGVLVDARKSYDATTVVATEKLLFKVSGVHLSWRKRAPLLIHMLRRTGAFNNDWDTTYALTLFAVLSLPSRYQKGLESTGNRGFTRSKALPVSEIDETFSGIKARIENLEKMFGQSKPASVDEFLTETASESELVISEKVREIIGYPGNPPASLLASLFDETYHGPDLFREMYGVDARYHLRAGYIEQDRKLVNESDMRRFSRLVGDGRLAMVTGRPRKAAEYSLGRLISYLDLEASLFLGEMDVDPQLTEQLVRFRKPSGLGLLYAKERLSARRPLYLGDSAEDAMMVRHAKNCDGQISFAGIYGTAYDESDQVELFKRHGAELILPSASDIPALLLRVMS